MEYRIAVDFGDQPLEIFDGTEPDSLTLDPSSCRLDNSYRSIDLMTEIANQYREDSVGEQYKNLYRSIPVRVVTVNKSTNKKESRLGDLGIIPKVDGSKKMIVLFSFFEVSALRFHCYVHRVYEETYAVN